MADKNLGELLIIKVEALAQVPDLAKKYKRNIDPAQDLNVRGVDRAIRILLDKNATKLELTMDRDVWQRFTQAVSEGKFKDGLAIAYAEQLCQLGVIGQPGLDEINRFFAKLPPEVRRSKVIDPEYYNRQLIPIPKTEYSAEPIVSATGLNFVSNGRRARPYGTIDEQLNRAYEYRVSLRKSR